MSWPLGNSANPVAGDACLHLCAISRYGISNVFTGGASVEDDRESPPKEWNDPPRTIPVSPRPKRFSPPVPQIVADQKISLRDCPAVARRNPGMESTRTTDRELR